MASSINNPAWAQWMTTLMGGVSRQALAATFPPDYFYCLLDELPLHLIPQRYLARLHLQQSSNQQLYLNPECFLCEAGEVPEEFASQKALLSRFAEGTVAWVPEQDTGNLLPFWLGPQLEDWLRGMSPNQPASPSIPEKTRRLLAATGILLPEDHIALRIRDGEKQKEKASVAFGEKGYVPLSGLIHPFHVAALRRYYRYLIRTGAIRLGDGQSPLRYVAYNEPVARFFHHQMARKLGAVAGEILKPSYVYLASYLAGAELKKHTDREQCEFSVTLCLDFSPEPVLATPWPIFLDTASGTVTVYQALGDGLAYRGTQLPHYRRPLSEGQTSTSIFFHYVGANFTGSLD